MPNNMMTLDLSHGTHTSLANISVASGGFVIVIIFTAFSNVLEYVNGEGKLYCGALSVEIWNRCLVSPSPGCRRFRAIFNRFLFFYFGFSPCVPV